MKKRFLCTLQQLKENSPNLFPIPQHPGVVVFKNGEEIAVYENRCPHAGAPLDAARFHKGVITCLWHGWKFRFPSGTCMTDDTPALRKIPVEIQENYVFIMLEEAPEKHPDDDH